VEEGQLIQSIERPQAGIELQAIDDRKRRVQPDVFGSKISVRIDYEPMADPIREQPAALPQETALNIENALKCAPIQVESLVEQDVSIKNDGSFH
jgi:hypothetical protein